MGSWDRTLTALQRSAGVTPEVQPDEGLRRTLLLAASVIYTVVGWLWGGAYAVLGEPWAALIPLGCGVLTGLNVLPGRDGRADQRAVRLLRLARGGSWAREGANHRGCLHGRWRRPPATRRPRRRGGIAGPGHARVPGARRPPAGRRPVVPDRHQLRAAWSHTVSPDVSRSALAHPLLEDAFVMEPRGLTEVKGKGKVPTWLLATSAAEHH